MSPENSILHKEKETSELTLQRLKENPSAHGNVDKTSRMIQTLEDKIEELERENKHQKTKTITSILALSRIQYDWDMHSYLPLIKDELSSHNQSYGLSMLSLYCLNSIDKVCMFFPMFWNHVVNHNPLPNSNDDYSKNNHNPKEIKEK